MGIGSDETILHYKSHRTLYNGRKRLFMVKSIRYVTDAYVNAGDGVMDFVPTVDIVRPDIFVVNEDGSAEEKRCFCAEHGIEYVVLRRPPQEGLEVRSSTDIKNNVCRIPMRLGLDVDRPALCVVLCAGVDNRGVFGADVRDLGPLAACRRRRGT